MKLEFYRRIFGKKKAHIPSFIKIRPMGAESIHAGRQTKLTVAFPDFANAPKKNPVSHGYTMATHV
jgi:hypothetical protein